MLMFVQLVQISRAQTTLENMKGHPQLSGPGALATAAVTAGTTSLEGAELTGHDTGPNAGAQDKPRKPKESWFEQWKKLLGIDTFIATAMHGSRADEVRARQGQNPFTRGCLTNCRDFFCDTAPVFGKRKNGEAMLGGEEVDYTSMYEPPPRMRMRTNLRGGSDVNYYSVNTDEEV